MSPDDFTFGRSLNRGCAQAKGDYIVIASSHVYPVYPDWLEQLTAPFEDERVAIVYGMQRGNDTTAFSEHEIFATWYPETSTVNQKHPFCNNANAAIRRSLWLQRAYNENLPGLEDLDWASWALSQDYRIAYSAEAKVIHVHDETYKQVFNRYKREAMGLKQIRPQETFQLWDFLRLYTSNVLSDLWHASSQGILRSVFSSIFAFRLMQFWGTYRGFREAGPLTMDLKKAFYYPRGIRTSIEDTQRKPEAIDYRTIARETQQKETGVPQSQIDFE
jgi:hypothetical protein